jgi:DNA-binding XRE family transcriptional regulator
LAAVVSAHATSPPERSAVVGKAVARAASLLGLTNAALARTIGVSEATASRLRAGAYALEPDSKPYELSLLLIRLFRGLDAVMNGDEAALRSWMVSTNRALGGVPRDLVQTAAGLVAAVDYVDAARARV